MDKYYALVVYYKDKISVEKIFKNYAKAVKAATRIQNKKDKDFVNVRIETTYLDDEE